MKRSRAHDILSVTESGRDNVAASQRVGRGDEAGECGSRKQGPFGLFLEEHFGIGALK